MSKSPTYEMEIPLIKVMLLGPSGVGKTAILRAFAKEEFCEAHLSTVGLDFRVRDIEVDNQLCKVQVIDTAGKEDLQVNMDSYFESTNALVYVYDITQEGARDRLRELKGFTNQKKMSPIYVNVLVGNKSEDSANRKISVELGGEIAKDFGMEFFEVSAKNDRYIKDLFVMIAKWYNEKLRNYSDENAKKLLENSNNNKEDKKFCCIII